MLAAILAGGCGSSSTTQPSDMYQRQENAMKDPFGYKPNFDKSRNSSSNIGTFDKEGFRKDLEDVFNP